jgi:hypothetical protein
MNRTDRLGIELAMRDAGPGADALFRVHHNRRNTAAVLATLSFRPADVQVHEETPHA